MTPSMMYLSRQAVFLPFVSVFHFFVIFSPRSLIVDNGTNMIVWRTGTRYQVSGIIGFIWYLVYYCWCATTTAAADSCTAPTSVCTIVNRGIECRTPYSTTTTTTTVQYHYRTTNNIIGITVVQYHYCTTNTKTSSSSTLKTSGQKLLILYKMMKYVSCELDWLHR